MNKSFYHLLLLTSILYAQDVTEKELGFIENTEQAETYLESYKIKGNKFIVFNEEKHKTLLARDLFELGQHGMKVTENEYEKTYYKILEKNAVLHYRVSYILLDGSKISGTDINTLQQRIISKFKLGVPFKDLAMQYSTDNNANRGGDLGWFTLGTMPLEFDNAVANGTHGLNDIYVLSIPSEEKYYVILQSHKPKYIAEIKVLKIVEPIE